MNAVKLALMIVMTVALSACNAQSTQDQKSVVADNEELQLYYFHFTKRCATCNAVENETKLALETFYAREVEDGTIAFTSLNLEEEDGRKMAEQLKVSGQSLLLVKGEHMLNLTNEGFMNARTKPDTFHEILKNSIDQLL